MNKWYVISLFLAVLLSTGCDKEEDRPVDRGSPPEFVVFGLFTLPNFCGSQEGCVEIFKMQSGELWEDVNDLYPSDFSTYSGDYSNPHSSEAYQEVENILRNSIPKELLEMESGRIGEPNPNIASMVYFEYKTADEYKYWIINANDLSINAVFTEFVSTVQNAVAVAQSD